MSMDDGFLLPGVFDVLPDGTPVTFHEAGIDRMSVMYDPSDIFPNDPDLDVETPEMRSRETLPQWGPNYVAAIHDRFSAIDRKLDELRDKAMQRWMFEPVTIVVPASMNTSGTPGGTNGAVDITTNPNAEIYSPPPGFSLAVHRFSIIDAAHTLGSPYTNAGSWWELRANGETIFGNSMVSGQGQLPVFASWGTRDALRVRDGEILSLFMSGGPGGAKLTCKMQGTLDRVIEG